MHIAEDQAGEEAALRAATAEIESGKSKKARANNLDSDYDADDDDPNTVSLAKLKSSFMLDLEMDEDGSVNQVPIISENAAEKDQEASPNVPSATPAAEDIKSFQPGSMPSGESFIHPLSNTSAFLGFRERFLVWNHIGLVTLFEGDESDNSSIEVEFHDTDFHHGIHLDNEGGFTMADLSKTALMLASPVGFPLC